MAKTAGEDLAKILWLKSETSEVTVVAVVVAVAVAVAVALLGKCLTFFAILADIVGVSSVNLFGEILSVIMINNVVVVVVVIEKLTSVFLFRCGSIVAPTTPVRLP